MALAFGDFGSGFRHKEVVMFINEEVLSNGGGPDFYMTYQARSWNEIEDGLRCVVVNPQAPHALKTACAWSALALGVRMASKEGEEHARSVQQLRQKLEESETATWALASQLVRLRKEHDSLVSQLWLAREALQQAQEQREAVRQQLLQAEGRLQQVAPAVFLPASSGLDMWPMNAEERNHLLSKMQKLRLAADSQTASTSGYSWSPEATTSGKQQLQGEALSLPKAPEALYEAEEYLAPSA